MLRRIAAVVMLALCASALTSHAQEPPRPASLSGIVTREGTGVPLPRATVSLFGPQDPPSATQPLDNFLDSLPPEYDLLKFRVDVRWSGRPMETVTDEQGRFLFDNLKPGRYSVMVQANGHVDKGAGGPMGAENAVTLTEGQVRTGLEVGLTPAANLAGQVFDSFKQPLPNVPVELLHPVYDWNGQRNIETVAETRTDDRGEFRFHWVTPGRYYLRSGYQALEKYLLSDAIEDLQNGNIGRRPTNPNEVPSDAGAAFYPGAPDITGARVIEIRPGEELSGIDWMAPPAPAMHTVRGRVIDSKTGKPPAQAEILAIRMNTGLPLQDELDDHAADKPRYNPSNGRLEIHNLTPGIYRIGAIVNKTSGFTTVTIADRDVDSITLTLVPPVLVSVNFRLEGEPPAPTASDSKRGTTHPWSVELRPVRTDVIPELFTYDDGSIGNTYSTADEPFRFGEIAGEYRISVFGLPPGAYIKAARMDGADVLDAPLHLAGATATLDIVISMHAGEIRGTVVENRGSPVFLIPDHARQRIGLYRIASPGTDGRFTIRGVAPGDYKLFSWEAVETFQWFDSEFIANFESKGTPVHVSESSVENTEVRLIRLGDAQ